MPEQVTSSANSRIARNSIYMIIRMVIVLIISLYTTRAVLSALGVEDYGVYNIVCGFVSMFAFLNSSMAGATQRFYNFELGKNGALGIRKVYNVAFYVHLFLGIAVVLLLELIGVWYITNHLVIPLDRYNASIWIFHFSTVSLFLNIINVPYVSVIMSYERMDFYAIIGIVDVVLKLIITLILPFLGGDALIIYGALFLMVSIFDFLAYRVYAKHNIPELNLGFAFSKRYLMEMLSYAGWNLMGSFAYMMREQGIDLLLNSFFGTIVNAARGVANQVNAALQSFTSSIVVPARPQIVQSYAKGDYNRSFHLMYSISKLSCIAFLMMSLPICFLVSPILYMWLGKNIPEHTTSFIIIMLITNTWGALVAPISTVVHATGKMKFYQTMSSFSNLLSVPLAYIFLKLDTIPEYVFIALLITMFTNHMAGLYSLKRLTKFQINDYVHKVIVPLVMTFVFTVLITYVTYISFSNRVVNFIMVFVISEISVILTSFFICFDAAEKNMVKFFCNKLLYR